MATEQILQLSPALEAKLAQLEKLQADYDARQREAEVKARQAEIETKARQIAEEQIEAALKKAGITKADPVKFGEAETQSRDARTSAAYKSAFEGFLRGTTTKAEMKALNEGTDTAGGFLVPEDFQAELIKKAAGFTALYRLVAKKSTGRDTLVLPKRVYTTDNKYTAGTRLTWTGEIPASATAARVTSNVYGQVRIPVHVGMATELVYRSVLEDSAVNVLGEIQDTFVTNVAQDLEYYLAQGTGAANPVGITVNATAQTNYVATGASTGNYFATGSAGAVALKNAYYGVPGQYRRQGAWVFNTNSLLAIATLVDGNGRFILQDVDQFGGGLGSKQYDADGMLLGRPFYISEQMPDPAANAFPVVFGDLSGYVMAERVGMSIARLDELYAETDAVAFVLRLRVGGELVEDYKIKLMKCAVS